MIGGLAALVMSLGAAWLYENLGYLFRMKGNDKKQNDIMNCTLADYSIQINFFNDDKENEWYRKFLKFSILKLTREKYEQCYKPVIKLIVRNTIYGQSILEAAAKIDEKELNDQFIKAFKLADTSEPKGKITRDEYLVYEKEMEKFARERLGQSIDLSENLKLEIFDLLTSMQEEEERFLTIEDLSLISTAKKLFDMDDEQQEAYFETTNRKNDLKRFLKAEIIEAVKKLNPVLEKQFMTEDEYEKYKNENKIKEDY